MRQQMLHTPEGTRDIYGIEYRRKIVLEERLQKVLHLYGYNDIQTPMFEYADVFGKEVETIPVKELYRFFDRDGNTLVLRPDITPSIARVATTLFSAEDLPLRLCYKGNTFINHSSYQGRLRENTQLGAELIGSASVESDAEMIAMAVESLKEVGLKDFQIHIGDVDFFEGLIEETQLEQEQEERLRELIANRNFFGVEELLECAQAKVTIKTAFQILPELVGGIEILKEAKKIALNFKTLEAARRLEHIYNVLVSYGVEKHVSFDLSMNGTYGYYTGIIFRGYTYGTGDAIVKGGRYDTMMGKFAKELPAIGFVIVVDELMSALGRQKIDIPNENRNTLILYDDSRVTEAISLAKEFRSKGKITEMVSKNTEKDMEHYVSYAKQNFCVNLMYLKKGTEIELTNLVNGKTKVLSSKVK